MDTYAAYRMDDQERFKTGRWIEAANHTEAMRRAAALFEPDTFVIRLWIGSVWVCDLPRRGRQHRSGRYRKSRR